MAFISDIGANALKPLFITGGIITAIALLGTIIRVHLVFHRRYARGHHGESQPRYKKVFSILAVLFQGVACPCQICLTVFDNHGHPSVHRLLLFLTFTGTALSAICTSIVFWSEMWTDPSTSNPTKEDNLRRRSVIASNVIFGIEICLGVVFTVLLRLGFYRISGIVEWVMAFLFTGYFWAFWGFLTLPGKEGGEGEGEGEGERTPLLR